MFANFRLSTVALFASIAALHCELGGFAAFAGGLRPLATDAEPLQLPRADHRS